MGCDIHLVLERRFDGKWVGVDTFAGHETAYGKGWSNPLARERNYVRFAALAAVRGDGPKPLGLPIDASDTTRALSDDWGVDGHSHSWLSLYEAGRVWLDTQSHPSKMAVSFPIVEFFGIDSSDHRTNVDDYRVVFWFDN